MLRCMETLVRTTLNGDEPVALVGPVVSGFLRLVTN